MTDPIQPSDAPPRLPSQPDPEDSGSFRWFQDLLDRILPKKDRERPR